MYVGLNSLAMIFCLVTPPLACNTRPCSKLGRTSLNGGEEEGDYYIAQKCN